MTGLFPSYKLKKIELILPFKSCIIHIFVHHVCMNSLFYTVKLLESYNKLHHTSCLMKDRLKSCMQFIFIVCRYEVYQNILKLSNKPLDFTEVWNSRVAKSSYEIELCKMTSHFEFLTRTFLRKFFF